MSEKNQPKPLVTKYTNCSVLRHGCLVVDDLWTFDGLFVDPETRFWEARDHQQYAADLVIDCKGAILAPGYIDIQLNGGFGIDFSSVSDVLSSSSDSLQAVARELPRYGVTSFLPTIITSDKENYRKIIPKLQPRVGSKENGASALGIHLEGPFIAIPGAHPVEHIKGSGPDGRPIELEDIIDTYGVLDGVRLITLAPELSGFSSCLAAFHSKFPSIVLSAGHSRASYDEALNACKAGCTLLTHLFNAMRPFSHRDPGIVGLLGTREVSPSAFAYSLICDGLHTHSASVRIAYFSHPTGAILVTDAISALGLCEGEYNLGAMKVKVEKVLNPGLSAAHEENQTESKHSLRATLVGTDTLAGSVCPMDECVRNFRCFTGCSTAQALEAASTRPAETLGLSGRKGTLNFGADADFIVLNDQLNVLATFIAGECVWKRDDSVFLEKIQANYKAP